MSSGTLSNPEPAPRPPILTNIYDATGRLVATLARRPGAETAILRDGRGIIRTRIDSENPALEAKRYIETHRHQFKPQEASCNVPMS